MAFHLVGFMKRTLLWDLRMRYRSAQMSGIVQPRFEIQTDASFMTADQKGSILAYIITWNGVIIAAKTLTMKRKARSVAEAEWSGYAAGLQDGHGCVMFIIELGDRDPYPMLVKGDSEATLIVVQTSKGTRKMKHMELDIYSTQYSLNFGLHEHQWVDGTNLPVDMMTKNLKSPTYLLRLLRSLPGVVGNFDFMKSAAFSEVCFFKPHLREYEISSSSSLGDVVPTSLSGMNFDYDLEEVPQFTVPKLVGTNP